MQRYNRFSFCHHHKAALMQQMCVLITAHLLFLFAPWGLTLCQELLSQLDFLQEELLHSFSILQIRQLGEADITALLT